jgi:hypothetical protein
VRRPAFWILLAVVSVAAAGVGVRYFPRAFSIVALNITMDREHALAEARRVMARDSLGPTDYRQAASFSGDDEAQTFVELEGGGKEAFTRMLRDELYAAYTWRVRHFREGERNETTILFTPDGKPYGFVEQLREDAPGASLDGAAARAIAEGAGGSRWNVDFRQLNLVEQGQERRPAGRVDHTFTYERMSETLKEGRYRLRLVVSGDRLTELTHFIRIPESFTRRYATMRSANEAIGAGSVVAMALLYVVGGIGVGLFFMLRRRYVLWRQAAFWGVTVGFLQTLAAVNEFPLLWMTYDTALPRSTFIAQQLTTMVAGFVGFSTFFALSFMTAETLTRRAFGHHPQLWRSWSRGGPGASTAILGRTLVGYLLVSVFFAYDVVLYLVMTKAFGWWSPADALVHPDVLATYAPWLSAIVNSFQAGFWEEALFRAVPLAGAALIGDRIGHRRACLVAGFVVQAIVFGSGHAPYPNQPAFARPVELIMPSIGFGLLYVYLGLLPGIILHFTFDVVWFALPIFLASAPGIWFDRVMILALTLVPLWIVLYRRVREGGWTELPESDRNAAWTPPAPREHVAAAPIVRRDELSPMVRRAWLGLGAFGLLFCTFAVMRQSAPGPFGTLPLPRSEASSLAWRAVDERLADTPPAERRPPNQGWRVLPVPDDGDASGHEFVVATSGEDRWRALLGTYLPRPRWRVRLASFEGDISERAEEWQVMVTASGEARNVRHTLPEGRAGASVDESAARRLAATAIQRRFGLDVGRGQLKEISATPAKLPSRTDWTFIFRDETIAPLRSGEPRIEVTLAGSETAAVGRYIYIPEEWQRRQRAADTRNRIVSLFDTVTFAALLLGSAVVGIIAWSRGSYAPSLFVAGSLTMLVASGTRAANSWPIALASFTTAAPLALQVTVAVALGLVGLALQGTVVGLALGAMPRRLAGGGHLPDREALHLGVAAGFFGAAIATGQAALRTPEWARVPDVNGAGAVFPVLQAAIGPVPGVLVAIVVVLSALLLVNRSTDWWTRRTLAGMAILIVIGFVISGVPAGVQAGGWITGGVLTAAGLLVAYVTLLRHDLTMVPVALAIMSAVGALARAAGRAYPGALPGSLIAAVLLLLVGWWWFAALRRPYVEAAAPDSPVAG